MNAALRQIITTPPIIPAWLRPYVVSWHDAGKRGDVRYGLTNLSTYGNFAADTDGDGLADGLVANNIATKSVLNNVQTFKGAAAASGFYISYPAIGGRKYYYRMTAACTSSAKVFPYDGYTQDDRVLTANGNFQTVSGVKTLNASANYIRLYAQATGSSGYADILCKQWMLFDLTAAFGTGNEPNAAEMDDILARDGTQYWEGARNVLCNPNGKYFWQDYSGNGRHGKLSNVAYVAGSNLSANGFEVDGVDDAITIADSPATRLTNGGTLCAWIKPKTQGETAGRIFDKSTDGYGTNGFYLAIYTNNSLLSRINASAGITQSADNVITLNKWQHVVITFNSSGRHLYVNGADVTASGGTETALPPDVAGSVYIGNRAGATDRTFDGYIDKARIINRALARDEVWRLYAAERKKYGV